ncbi:MAG: hypothetical protein ACOCWM_03240 [Cyclobacteriaceae bacterium]
MELIKNQNLDYLIENCNLDVLNEESLLHIDGGDKFMRDLGNWLGRVYAHMLNNEENNPSDLKSWALAY